MTIIIGFILLAAVSFFLFATISDQKKNKDEPKKELHWFWNIAIIALFSVIHPYLMLAYVLFLLVLWIVFGIKDYQESK